jgi:hypothetical protein
MITIAFLDFWGAFPVSEKISIKGIGFLKEELPKFFILI